jgi:uncharacterized Zn ribbon protein
MDKLGINRHCTKCNQIFYCTDGGYFCSNGCYEKYEKCESILAAEEDQVNNDKFNNKGGN